MRTRSRRRRRVWGFSALGVLLLIALTPAVLEFTEAPAQPPEVPALKCYDVRHTLPRDQQKVIAVRDQFGTLEVNVRLASKLCEPVTKTHPPQLPGPAPDLLPYLCYKVTLRGVDLRKEVRLTDQFAQSRSTKVREPSLFCDPTILKVIHLFRANKKIQEPSPLPPLLCYRVRSGLFEDKLPEAVRINLRDQFFEDPVNHAENDVKIQKLKLLCEPATKDPEQAPPPGKSLTCYQIEQVGTRPPAPPQTRRRPLQVTVEDQFDRPTLRLGRPSLFCDPAIKELVQAQLGGGAQGFHEERAPLRFLGAQVQAPPSGSGSGDVLFRVEGTGIAAAQVRMFDLSGRLIYDSGFLPGRQLRWDRHDAQGRQVANGVYLYVLHVRGFHGEVAVSAVRKLGLLR